MHRHSLALLTTAALVAAPLTGLTTSSASASVADREIVGRHLVTPLSAAVQSNGTIFVSQNFAGLLTRVRPGKDPRVVLAIKRAELGALSVRQGVVTFGVTKNSGTTLVRQWEPDGTVTTLANISNFEESDDPDASVEYGVVDITEECEADWPVQDLGPATYTGITESHPYATTSIGDTTYLADAAANAIFEIGSDGTVSTLAVLPPVPIEITPQMAEEVGAPDCVIGLDYLAEPVPTDVEAGPDGLLHVTSLPGGPGESLPAGSVFSVDPANGDVETEVEGLFTPVGLAVTPSGDMYVSELFAGDVVKVPSGSSSPETFRSTMMPGALEYRDGSLVATVKVLDEETGGRLMVWPLP